MADRCSHCRNVLEPGSRVCTACGACFDQGLRGYAGRPNAILACRVFVIAGWGLWVCTCVLGGAFRGEEMLVPGIALVPLSFATMLAGAKAWCPAAWVLGLLNLSAWIAVECIFEDVIDLMADEETAAVLFALGYTAVSAPFAIRFWARPIAAHDPWRCRQCGYLLRGLRNARCPECGTPFEIGRLKWLTRPGRLARNESPRPPTEPN